jgi:Na+-transporting NADH:ubiquinone oxidoreductase subunit C
VLGFMLAISVFFGTGVSLVHHGTKDMLARNEQTAPQPDHRPGL